MDGWHDLDAALAGLLRDDAGPAGGLPDAPVSPAPPREIPADQKLTRVVRRPGPGVRRPRAVRRPAEAVPADAITEHIPALTDLGPVASAAATPATVAPPPAPPSVVAPATADPTPAAPQTPRPASAAGPAAVPTAHDVTTPAASPLLDDATAAELDDATADLLRRTPPTAEDDATADLLRRAGYEPPEIDPAVPRRGVAALRPGLGRHHASGRIRTAWEARYMRTLVAIDLLAGLGAGAIAFGVRFGNEVTAYNKGYVLLTALLPLLLILTLTFNRAYERRFLFVGTDEYERVLRAGLMLTAMTAVVSYAFDVGLARGYVSLALPSATLASIAGRFALRKHLHAQRARGRCLRRVIVVGHELAVVGVAHQLGRELYHGLEVVGCCLPPDHDGNVGLPVYGTFDDVGVAVQAAKADTVIVLSCPELDGQMLRRLAWRLEREDIDLIVASTLVDVAGARTTVRPVDGLPMLHIEHPRLSGASRAVKSVFDRVGAALGLLVLAPVLLAIALLIKRDSAGPVLFRQIRVGKGGREFVIFKFRTMCTDAEARLATLKQSQDGVLFKLRDDPRVTRVGRMLRRLSLDELPQLLNVLFGDMSLVGPRPPLPEEVAAYPSDMRRRLAVSPGMTGLWQVSGRSDLSWDETVRLDLRYVENWSFTLDLMILLRTLSAVCRSSGAY